MSTPIISVENLSKRYHLGQIGATTLRDSAERLTHRLRRGELFGSSVARLPRNGPKAFSSSTTQQPNNSTTDSDDLWALRDVSFEVQPGEVLGIIGRNGAGKSTLLKILSRITEPTSGRAIIRGRVASLLEVGTGFHPELSGRENIFLNGAILGMRHAEIARKFDEIVAFAEVERFIDTPVKRYSSGMYVRLAFAVAAHLEPEILVVDEVLAVGDMEFQKKCLGKMNEVSKGGRTVLFVSHNMAAVQNLCSRCMILRNGCLQTIGATEDAIAYYLVSLGSIKKSLASRMDRIGTGEVYVESMDVIDENGNTLESVVSGQDIRIRLHFKKETALLHSRIIASLEFKTQMDVPVFLHHNRLSRECFGPLPQQGCFELRIKRLPLPPSVYRISYSLLEDGAYVDYINDALELTVTAGDFFKSGEVPPVTHGVCLVDGAWSLKSAESVRL